MPAHDFECRDCGRHKEFVFKITEDVPETAEASCQCNNHELTTYQRVWNTPGIHWKGPGLTPSRSPNRS